jgi:hypothetical protein
MDDVIVLKHILKKSVLRVQSGSFAVTGWCVTAGSCVGGDELRVFIKFLGLFKYPRLLSVFAVINM